MIIDGWLETKAGKIICNYEKTRTVNAVVKASRGGTTGEASANSQVLLLLVT